ncbi:glycosyltransferase family 9 protein [Synechocystis sp. PCC 7509]|uniref:glycosyltransferase family 9 protein n=1 Tax=Synechocystis sp. PCC 7509 TaxID=927677 RepID=UPI0002ACAA83|nr:glycosyltransferase family 9 protein [Synechocystis sp. PCC 7509]
MRIVALVPGKIGEQILFFPTLDDLQRVYPDAQIDVVVEPRAKAAYRVCKSVTDTIAFDFKDRNSLADWGNLIGLLRDREYDIAISPQQQSLPHLLLWLTGIPTRIGYKGKGSIFLTDPVPQKLQQSPAAKYHDLLQGLGINSPVPELNINVPSSDITWSEKEQKRLGINESGYVVFYDRPSPDHNSTYPIDSWRQIVQSLQEKQPNLPVVAIKDPENELFVKSMLAFFPDLKVTSPEDIGKLAATIAAANLLVCTDSAPMYLALAVQTYTVVLGETSIKSDRLMEVKSSTAKIADIAPQTVMQRIWGQS